LSSERSANAISFEEEVVGSLQERDVLPNGWKELIERQCQKGNGLRLVLPFFFFPSKRAKREMGREKII
jgi:hypothetical protein